MTLVAISIVIAIIIFIGYNIFTVAKYNIPQSLSMTYYLLKDESEKLKILFPAMMYLVVALIMPAWLTISEGSPFQFLAFLAPASLLFVGTAPAFMSSPLENKVHSISAILAAVFSILWICLVTPYWLTIPIWLGYIALFAILTSTYKTSYIYWLEMVAFGATLTTTLMHSLV